MSNFLFLSFVIFFFATTHTSASGEIKKSKEKSQGQAAVVQLSAKSGSQVSGMLSIIPLKKGIRLKGEISGLKPESKHGFHIHEKSDCSAPDASSAGGHFNPKNTAHGGPKDHERHLGDLGNITADKDGKVKINRLLLRLTLYPLTAENSIVGKTIIVHKHMDDKNSQPSGNAGPRIACGMIKF